MATPEVQTEYRPQVFLVGDVVGYHGRTWTIYQVDTTQWGPLFHLKTPYYTRGRRGSRVQHFSYASTYDTGALS